MGAIFFFFPAISMSSTYPYGQEKSTINGRKFKISNALQKQLPKKTFCMEWTDYFCTTRNSFFNVKLKVSISYCLHSTLFSLLNFISFIFMSLHLYSSLFISLLFFSSIVSFVSLCVVVCRCVSLCVVVCRCVWPRWKPRVSIQNASVCTFQTFPCVPAPRTHAFQHVRVVLVQTEAFWMDIWECEGIEVVIASCAYQKWSTQGHHLAQRFTESNHWILPIFVSLRRGREQHVPDSSNHSFYPDKAIELQLTWGKLRKESATEWFDQFFALFSKYNERFSRQYR